VTEFPVRVDPAGVVIGVWPDEPVLAAAVREGYRWPSVCGGEAMCGTCFVKVQDGAEHTSAVQSRERTRLKFLGRAADPTVRLACQMRISGAVSVFKRGVRKPA
jgi:2Fe-2S ferredoxin